MIGLLVIGVPVAYALGIAGSAMLLLVAPLPTVETLLTSVVHHSVANYVILTIPAFVMMSEFLSAGGIADDMMIACNRMLRKLRGGLDVACGLAVAVLAPPSGRSPPSVATMSRAAFPTHPPPCYHVGPGV